nr:MULTISPECIES: DEAD/DEAH box helicase [unclassified Rudaea]
MALKNFHPAVAAWFAAAFPAPTPAQTRAWPAIQSGRHTLIAAPTGSGKTLAAFLAAIDELVRLGVDGALADETRIIYVSPLKALSNDVQINLQAPIEGIRAELAAQGFPDVEIRAVVRTGDTPQAERAAMKRRAPHIVVTTPESLYILLGSDSGRAMLATTHSVIVDEIHALAPSKRGAHLALSLERLDALCGRKLTRIGLSATQKPISEVAKFLVGSSPPFSLWEKVPKADKGEALQSEYAVKNGNALPSPEMFRTSTAAGEAAEDMCEIIDVGYVRERDLALELPPAPLSAVMSGDVWMTLYQRLAELIQAHKTTLIFVNTRRMAERLAKHLSDLLGKEAVTSHHGSLAREQRLAAEQRLKRGELRALVATASLELGIDIGDVDLVCQIASPRSISTFLQRVGRANHSVDGTPKARLFPLSRDDLIECTALLDTVRRSELDTLHVERDARDVLAQQIVAEVACREWSEQELFDTIRNAYPFADLTLDAYRDILRMLAEGYTTRRGPRSAYLHRDAVNGVLRARRGARLTALTSGGAIPDTADYEVVLEPQGSRIGTVHEDFAVESMAGDIFQLGNTSYRVLRVERGRMRVEDAKGAPPTLPFWLGEAPGRSDELSFAVSRLREEVSAQLEFGADTAERWLREQIGLNESAARQIVDYLGATQAALGLLPTQTQLAMERFFDESGGTQLVIHSPFGSRMNRAWGLALRKRFCRTFNFELQAAATEDAIVLSLSTSHSFPLIEVSRYLHSNTAEHILVQALLDAPMFGLRWRWNAVTALALPRFAGGTKVAPQLQRMKSEDLLATVFPDQVACLENIVGERQIPDHPLVAQTLHDCLHEAMDVDALLRLLKMLESGEIHIVARDLTAPSPLAAEILTARPYAFLDDAPLEERRTQAVQNRRWGDIETTDDFARLDAAAIASVREEAWPEARNPDELHEALMGLGFVTVAEMRNNASWREMFDQLIAQQRATTVVSDTLAHHPDESWDSAPLKRKEETLDSGFRRNDEQTQNICIPTERLPQFAAIFPELRCEPALVVPEEYAAVEWAREEALVEIVRSRLTGLGPVRAGDLAGSLGVAQADIDLALLTLERQGFVMQGHFTSDAYVKSPAGDGEAVADGLATGTEWCERHLLARIHRYTVNRLRREIEPVEPRDYMRFLFEWQRAAPGTQVSGPDALAGILAQLEGFEAPAAAWENEILPARIGGYEISWLDDLCLSGRIVWTRLRNSGRRPSADAPLPPNGRGGDHSRSEWWGEGDRRASVTSAASGNSAAVARTDNGSSSRPRTASGPVRATPIVLLQRRNLALWNALGASTQSAQPGLSSRAQAVADSLREHGASFFDELATATRLLHSELEDALAELVAAGLINSDSFAGLRALLVPTSKRPSPSRRRGRRTALLGIADAGRWSLLRKAGIRDSGFGIREDVSGVGLAADGSVAKAAKPSGAQKQDAESVEQIVRTLLKRYGLICWRLVAREASWLPPWREMLRVCHRLEARGEIRGGRFIAGLTGEQFALPEAIAPLRAIRNKPRDGSLVSVCGADPLNQVGHLIAGTRVPNLAGARVLYRDGAPIAALVAGEFNALEAMDEAAQWAAKKRLLQGAPEPVHAQSAEAETIAAHDALSNSSLPFPSAQK